MASSLKCWNSGGQAGAEVSATGGDMKESICPGQFSAPHAPRTQQRNKDKTTTMNSCFQTEEWETRSRHGAGLSDSKIPLLNYLDDSLWLGTGFTSWEWLPVFYSLWPLVQPSCRFFLFHHSSSHLRWLSKEYALPDDWAAFFSSRPSPRQPEVHRPFFFSNFLFKCSLVNIHVLPPDNQKSTGHFFKFFT